MPGTKAKRNSQQIEVAESGQSHSNINGVQRLQPPDLSTPRCMPFMTLSIPEVTRKTVILTVFLVSALRTLAKDFELVR